MRGGWLILILILAVPAGAVSVSLRATPTQDCEAPEYVDGLGWACGKPGDWTVRLADGTLVRSHGPDAAPSITLDFVDTNWAPRIPPLCIADPLLERHGHVIYAYPVHKGDSSATRVPILRDLIARVNGLLVEESGEFGTRLDYKFLCNEEGQVRIDVEPIVTRETAIAECPEDDTGTCERASTSFVVLTSTLKARGYDNTRAKYWVFYDDPSGCTCGGVGSFYNDPVKNHLNKANAGPSFGITYGYTGNSGVRILMHENGHNLGAVNNNAPDSSGAGHCNDGQDIMCYGDGGPTAAYKGNVCSVSHFDCHHDSYFNPDPAPGTWVANKWNLGSPFNRFFTGCVEESGILPAGVAGVVTPTARVEVPTACAGHWFAAFPEHPFWPTDNTEITVGSSLGDVDVCFEDATGADLHCFAQRFYEEGRVPAGAVAARVTNNAAYDVQWTLKVN